MRSTAPNFLRGKLNLVYDCGSLVRVSIMPIFHITLIIYNIVIAGTLLALCDIICVDINTNSGDAN